MTNPATGYELVGLLGELDPFVLDEIQSTGASLDEVQAALAIVSADRRGELLEGSPSLRVEAVRAILEELDDRTDEYAEYPVHGIA